MLERVSGDWRQGAVAEIRVAGAAIMAVLAAAATLGLLCAALFVFVMDRYNVLYACLGVAAVLFCVSVALFGLYLSTRGQRDREAAASLAMRQSLLADPIVVTTAVQIIEAIGFKKVMALLAVAGTGIALASRPRVRIRRQGSD